MPQAGGFTLNADGVAEPVDLHPQFRQRLLHHPRFATESLDQDRAVGDAAGQDGDRGRFVDRDATGLPEVVDQRAGLFDVEGGHGWGSRVITPFAAL